MTEKAVKYIFSAVVIHKKAAGFHIIFDFIRNNFTLFMKIFYYRMTSCARNRNFAQELCVPRSTLSLSARPGPIRLLIF